MGDKGAYNQAAYKRAKRTLAGQPCIYCGAPSDSVEHLTPLAQGGTNHPSNLAPACLTCNQRRGGHLGNQRRRARRRQTYRNRKFQ